MKSQVIVSENDEMNVREMPQPKHLTGIQPIDFAHNVEFG